jgi:3-phenylpropionate/cinnamic acid dioxygenase small subunit
VEIEQFLYHEAKLLEENKLHDWLGLLTEDVRDLIPAIGTVQGGTSEGQAEPKLMFHMSDDDKRSLAFKVARLDTGLAHAETPPSRTTRLITNVQVEGRLPGGEVEVSSRFLVLQVRPNAQAWLMGSRKDLLRRTQTDWKIARRVIHMADDLLPQTISVFL